MWDKPKKLKSYTGNGFEITAWKSGGVNAQSALNGWKQSSGHNQVIVNAGMWKIVIGKRLVLVSMVIMQLFGSEIYQTMQNNYFTFNIFTIINQNFSS